MGRFTKSTLAFFLLAGTLTLSSVAKSEVIPALQTQILENLQAFDGIQMQESQENLLADQGNQEKWILKNLYLRVRAKLGFEIPVFAKFQVIPEMEILWQKPNPSGWDNYKP